MIAAFVAAAALAGSSPPVLVGTVGPGFTISLADEQGNPVQHVDPGTYTLLVHDRSPEHNFHLFGPGGVDVTVTTVPFVGDETVTVTLVAGNYQYQCDPHADSGMAGLLSVGTSPPPPKPHVKKRRHRLPISEQR